MIGGVGKWGGREGSGDWWGSGEGGREEVIGGVGKWGGREGRGDWWGGEVGREGGKR